MRPGHTPSKPGEPDPVTIENNDRKIERRSVRGVASPTVGAGALDLTILRPPPAAAAPDPTASPTAKPDADGADVVEQIRKLGELRDAGLLTADKFEAKKIDLLSRLWR